MHIARDSSGTRRLLGLNHPQMPYLRRGREEAPGDDASSLTRNRPRLADVSDRPSPRVHPP
jgi:hypothetical protein